MTGSLRRHVNTKLVKASSYSAQLVELLRDEESKATEQDVIEAKAHNASMRGAVNFERHDWEACLQAYCLSYTVYTSLVNAQRLTRIEMINELLSGTIEPNIRYAAHQLKISRTKSIDTIVKRYAKPQNDPGIQSFIEAIAPTKKDTGSLSDVPTLDVPRDIQWRGRTVPIEDASIAHAIATTNAAATKLSRFLSKRGLKREKQASAYDEVLIAAQDSVDATKTAIDELAAEGVPQHDRRMQALQITRTAVNYELVGWRVGRNRVLCGPDDGASLEPADSHRTLSKPKKRDRREEGKPDGTSQASTAKETIPRSMRRLRERAVLYDGILQSFESIKELPGVAADSEFVSELEAKRAYFASLRCLAVARGHELVGQSKNALALLSKAKELAAIPASHQSIREPRESSEKHRAPTLDITSSQASSSLSLLQSLTLRHRALVELDNINDIDSSKSGNSQRPLIERLNEWPKSGKVDLGNLIKYPPEIECVPVKPIYLDLAWNYVQYTGEKRKMPESLADTVSSKEEKKARGWFGFGR